MPGSVCFFNINLQTVLSGAKYKKHFVFQSILVKKSAGNKEEEMPKLTDS